MVVATMPITHITALAHDAAKTVTIFAPGGYDADPSRLVHASRYFEARGYRVEPRLTVGGRHDRFSGPDDERLRWLAAVCADQDAGIAISLRGGYGATRLLPKIDFDAMASAVARGKRFVGHSDFTAISLGLLARTGAISFAGPMASFGFGRESVDPFTEEHFWRAMEASRVEVAFATPASDVEASGVLWGGNLAMLTSLIGTPWMPAIDGGILFVEDINEQPYRIERMLLQLKQAGVLDRQRLVLCGDFSDYRVADYDNGYDIDAALAYVRQTTATPIIAGLPFGHGPKTLTLAVGALADVKVADGHCTLNQRWKLG
jgi:muramoyltetrapeptide carboxypeptidase